jgi:hypothetical protein
MAWKLKKEWEGKTLNSINCPLEDLTQKQILKLKEETRNLLFVEDKPKKKKKDVGFEG